MAESVRRPAVITLAEMLGRLEAYWTPGIVAELNGQHVKLAKLKGEFVWHRHPNEDEMFLVLKGELKIELRDGALVAGPGQICVVPRGTEHRPTAEKETHVLLFEPAGTLNTGDRRNEKTISDPDWL